jgi:hypothetical protein
MKRRLLVPLALLLTMFFCSTQKSDAQITGVSVDSLMTYGGACSLPSMASIMIQGQATGTVIAGDSVTVYINFGDGSDTTFDMSLYVNQGYYFAFIDHYYQMPALLP